MLMAMKALANHIINRDHSFPRNYEPSHGISVFMEFCGIEYGTGRWYRGQIRHDTLEEFRLLYMISPWNTWLPLGLWWEEHWKYWAELIWNIASLFGRQTASVSCSYWRQRLHIRWGSEATENLLLYVENLPRWAMKFGKLGHRIWRNLPRKTVFPSHKWQLLTLLLKHKLSPSCALPNSSKEQKGCANSYCNTVIVTHACTQSCISVSIAVYLSS